MTFKNWLKRIYLLPFSVLMGIPEGGEEGEGLNPEALSEIAGNEGTLGSRIMKLAAADGHVELDETKDKQDAAADKAKAVDPDQQGKQGEDDKSDGLDTASKDAQDTGLEDDDNEDPDDLKSQEADKAEEETNKLPRKSLDARVDEMVKKRLAELQAEQRSELPDFAPPETVQKVKQNIVKKQAEIREIESELDLEGDEVDQEKIDKLFALQEYVDEARRALKENAEKEKAYNERQSVKKTSSEGGDLAKKELDDVSELYRSELKIDEKTWGQMAEWFQDQMMAKPLLVKEFNDVYARGGPVATVRFAHGYTVEHMGKGTKKANEQRDAAKNKSAALTSGTGKKEIPVDYKVAKQAFNVNPSEENFQRLQAAKRARAAT
jgi:hypothetical protein